MFSTVHYNIRIESSRQHPGMTHDALRDLDQILGTRDKNKLCGRGRGTKERLEGSNPLGLKLDKNWRPSSTSKAQRSEYR